MTGFVLDPRLAADTLAISTLTSGPLLLMNDRRWPWLILVPAVAGAEEWHDLDVVVAAQLHADTMRLGQALKRVTGCTKINTGALGNVVRQLHVHVVARSEGDPNWPGPVWGFGERQEWPHEEATALAARIRKTLEDDND